MKFLKNRVLPVVCAFSLLLSLCLPALATFDSAYSDYDSVNQWTYQFLNLTGTVNARLLDAYCELKGLPTDTDPVEVTWSFFNTAVSTYGEVDLGALNQLVSTYNGYFNLPASESGYSFGEYAVNLGRNVVAGLLGLPGMHFEVQAHPSSGLLRIKETTYDIWVVNSEGMYPYVDPNTSDESVADQWIGEVTAADRATKEVAIHTLDRLNMMCLQLRDAGIPAQIKTLGTNYKCIWYNRQVYANADGVPYVAWFDEDKAAVNQDRPTTNVTENGDIIEGDLTDNSTNIDLENMLITLPNGSINIIDQIIYDESTKSYHIDSHDTYNYTTNNYYTWNYYINYTSVTYIGQTEEYNKYYEVYYELPDGRDSADLTKEDLEQLNLAIDVIPYARAADDVAIKALYHFDGDTRDASFWNYTGKFQWNKGASITYMDAAVFDGALYLDETEHDFSFVLPQLIGDNTFVMQWRYYQSATAAPVTDSYVRFGTKSIMRFDGNSILDASGAVLADMPIGTWNEIAIMRKDSAVYLYLNGLVIGSYSLGSLPSNIVNFHFGKEQQTFKYFDEFRFVTDEVYSIGKSYTPTAVPFDTNLTLVVPDGDYIVADEWVGWSGGESAYVSIDFTCGEFDEFGDENEHPNFVNPLTIINRGTSFTVDSEWTEKGLVLTRSSGSGSVGNNQASGLALSMDRYSSLFKNGEYPNLVIWGADGNGRIWTYFHCLSSSNQEFTFSSGEFSGSNMCINAHNTSDPYILIYPYSDSCTISRIDVYPQEVGPSDFAAPVTHGAVSVMNPEQLRSPTLAVRTDLDITGYQIGGVRPSVPKKGQVWALVENQRITSIQIYNGQAWESCDGRIWTGERWIPASSYNIVTLQDMYDIVDATPDYEYIYTESGFWSWWQKSWNAFTDKLFSLLGTGGTGGSSGATGGSGSSGLKDVDLDEDAVPSDPDQEDSKSLWQFIVLVIDGGKSVVGGVRHLFSGVVSTIPDTMDGITGAFDSGGVAVGLVDGAGADPDVSGETYSAAEGEVLDPWRYR